MTKMPQDVIERTRVLLENSRSSHDPVIRYQKGFGVYVGRATPKRFFVPRQPVYKIGQTTNFEKRLSQLATVYKVKDVNTHFIEVALNSAVEGILHNIFADVHATDYVSCEREWFYLSNNDVRWLHSFEAINSKILFEGIQELVNDLLVCGYTKTVIKKWFRLRGL